jgi:isopentenyl diphosphate isomerase/L-lactate dehydrogenase-like FMN-dependent dehydrogenase
VEALMRIAAAKGRLTAFVDGGVRGGTDVLKKIALGTEAVSAGRCPWPRSAAGAEGIALLLNRYAEQLGTAMICAGCRTLADIGPSAL